MVKWWILGGRSALSVCSYCYDKNQPVGETLTTPQKPDKMTVEGIEWFSDW